MQQALANGVRLPSLFSTVDEQYHAQLRRPVNSAFSMSALVQYEPSVDAATTKFLDQTEAFFASRGAVCDFAKWLQWYAFDVIGEVTYSKRHGFIDDGRDVDGMVKYLGRIFSYVAPVWLPHALLVSLVIVFIDGRLVKSLSWISFFLRIRS